LSRFRKRAERPVHTGSLISVGIGEFEAPDGSVFERDIVHHPGAVSVVPVTDDGATVLMVRQYRVAIEADLLEIPAGKRDVVDEPTETTARRELAEEVGMRAGRLEKLCDFYNTPGFCDEFSTVYLALDLEPTASTAHSVEEQYMTVVQVALDDVPGMIARGEILDAKSIIGLCLARQVLDGTADR
jgi:8-oxo-dGTP pyrophosphatase MutT (NUDIX family)